MDPSITHSIIFGSRNARVLAMHPSIDIAMPSVKVWLPSALVLLLLSTASSEDPAWLNCGDPQPPPPPFTSPSPSPSSSNSGTFRANLVELLGALPQAAAATGFASLSLGNGSDRAFVRGLCRGDSAPPVCLANMQAAVRNLSGSCLSSRRAGAWFDRCYVTYADTSAPTDAEENFGGILYDTRKLADQDRASYEQTYYSLMNRLVSRAAAGAGAGEGSARMFATGEAEYATGEPNGTMYGLVQCMQDLTAAECSRCLQSSVPQQVICCQGQQGGVVLRYNCYLRIQIYTYYDLALDASPPAAQPPPPPAPLPTGEKRGKRRSRNVILAVAVSTGTLVVLIILVIVRVHMQRRRTKKNERPRHARVTGNTRAEDSTYVQPEQFTLPLLKAATGNFAAENKLGEGGFGEVFKGKLRDGQKIAVKRLSQRSAQGFPELKNELVLAAKLKHRNLVQLLGVCLGEQEKLVVYEYLPNRSLDTILFDTGRRRRQALDWKRRYTIIRGITRGLQYLHEESRLRIIHRDLKASNILLDADMNPKISDFGLARALWGDQSKEVTKRAAGTLGYMSPEYAYYGHVSTKSDMFSFGVIVLEIVTGRRNTDPCEDDNASNLISYVWEKWRGGLVAEAVDASLGGQYPQLQMLNCVQVGLLCVQKKPELRPDASAAGLMLDSHSTSSLQTPSRPAFYSAPSAVASHATGRHKGDVWRTAVSVNAVSVSELEPR